MVGTAAAYTQDSRIAVRFADECHEVTGIRHRSYGNENWEFDGQGLMLVRFASINDLAIDERDSKFQWPLGGRQTIILH